MPTPTLTMSTMSTKMKNLTPTPEETKELKAQFEKDVFEVSAIMADVLDQQPRSLRFTALTALAALAENGMIVAHGDTPAMNKIGHDFGSKLWGLLFSIPGPNKNEEYHDEDCDTIYNTINSKLNNQSAISIYEAAVVVITARVSEMTCKHHFTEFKSRLGKIEDDLSSALADLDSETPAQIKNPQR
jgi:hypothetical protein